MATCAAVGALLLSAGLRCIWGADFWWQWRTGQYVLVQGIPRTDAFSFTVAGAPWIELRWAFCAGLYALFQAFGPAGVVIAKSAVVVASFALVTASVSRGRSGIVTAAVLLLAILASSQRFGPRPELASLFFVAFYLFVIERYRRSGGWLIAALPLFQLVWVNTHTTFILGPVIVCLWLVATAIEFALRRARGPCTDVAPQSPAALRKVAYVAIFVCVACLANPYGIRGVMFPFQLLSQIRGTAFKNYITEFRGAFDVGGEFVAIAAFKTLIGVCIATAALSIRRLDVFRTLVLVAFGYLAVTAVRNLPLFALAAIPFVTTHLSDSPLWQRTSKRRLAEPFRWLGSVAVILVCTAAAWGLFTDRLSVRQGDTNQSGFGVARHFYPSAATAFVREQKLPDPIFSTMVESSTLIAQGRAVFFDPRLEVYGEERFARYMRIQEDPAEWSRAATEFGFRTALVSLESRLINTLWSDAQWRLVFFDTVAAVFVRVDDAGAIPDLRSPTAMRAALEAIRRELPAPRDASTLGIFERQSSPAPYRRIGVFLMALGFPAEAEGFLADAVRAYPEVRGVRSLLGQALEVRGDGAGALRQYEAARIEQPDNCDVGLRLANLYLAVRRLPDAERVINDVLAQQPDFAAAWAVKGGVHATSGDLTAARQSLQRAVQLDPTNARYSHDLSIVDAAVRQQAGTGS